VYVILNVAHKEPQTSTNSLIIDHNNNSIIISSKLLHIDPKVIKCTILYSQVNALFIHLTLKQVGILYSSHAQ